MSRLREVAIGVGVALAVFGVDALRTEATQRLHKVKEQNDVYALPPPKLVRVLTLGHTDAAASILWASTLYQYGEHLGQNRRFQYSTQYLETILELDPGFRPAYRFLSTLVTMQAANPMPIEIDRTDKLFARGAELYPEDAGILGAYAAFLLFEGAQFLPPEEKKAFRLRGAPLAQRAVELGYFMDTINIAGASYLAQAGAKGLAIAQLERAYAVATNDDVRERIAARLRKLQGDAALERAQRAMQGFVQVWRSEAPFVSESTMLLLGKQPAWARCAGLAGLPSGSLGADPACSAAFE